MAGMHWIHHRCGIISVLWYTQMKLKCGLPLKLLSNTYELYFLICLLILSHIYFLMYISSTKIIPRFLDLVLGYQFWLTPVKIQIFIIWTVSFQFFKIKFWSFSKRCTLARCSLFIYQQSKKKFLCSQAIQRVRDSNFKT